MSRFRCARFRQRLARLVSKLLCLKSGEPKTLRLPSSGSRVVRKRSMSCLIQCYLPIVCASTLWRSARGCRRCTVFGSTSKQAVLLSYGPNWPDQWRRAADIVDKILRGMKPGDIPVEQPTKFEFIINLTTAKALGLTIPASLMSRADELIE